MLLIFIEYRKPIFRAWNKQVGKCGCLNLTSSGEITRYFYSFWHWCVYNDMQETPTGFFLFYNIQYSNEQIWLLQVDFSTSQQLESLLILGESVFNNFLRKLNASVLVKVDRLEIITQELLVKTVLRAASFIFAGRPETRRIYVFGPIRYCIANSYSLDTYRESILHQPTPNYYPHPNRIQTWYQQW